MVLGILALPSTLASLDVEKDSIVPESKDNEPVEFINKIMRGLEFLVTKVRKCIMHPKPRPRQLFKWSQMSKIARWLSTLSRHHRLSQPGQSHPMQTAATIAMILN